MRRVDRRGSELEGLCDEVFDGRVVEDCGGAELDVTGLFAAAFEKSRGVAEAGAVLQKEEADPARKERDGEDCLGGTVGGAEANGECVVVVVDDFLGTRQAGAHFTEGDSSLGGDFGCVLVEEGIELGGGGGFPRGERRSLLCRSRFAGRARWHLRGMVAGRMWLGEERGRSATQNRPKTLKKEGDLRRGESVQLRTEWCAG